MAWLPQRVYNIIYIYSICLSYIYYYNKIYIIIYINLVSHSEWTMDHIHHPGSSNKCWIQERWHQRCFLGCMVLCLWKEPKKTEFKFILFSNAKFWYSRGGLSTAPIGLSTILLGRSTVLIGLSTVCPRFVHGFVFFRFFFVQLFSFEKKMRCLKPST